MVAGTESNALPLFAPHAPPLTIGTTGTLERPYNSKVCIVTGRVQVAMVEHTHIVCDLLCVESNWSQLDPAVRTPAMSTIDHCLKSCEFSARTANGLVAKLVLAKGLSEKGLLLADIRAPPGNQNTSGGLRQTSELNALETLPAAAWLPTIPLKSCSRTAHVLEDRNSAQFRASTAVTADAGCDRRR